MVNPGEELGGELHEARPFHRSWGDFSDPKQHEAVPSALLIQQCASVPLTPLCI